MNYKLREVGVFPDIELFHDADGLLHAVKMTAKFRGETTRVQLWWFPSREICESERKAMVDAGDFPDADELR